MLYTYILDKDRVNEYFPETEEVEDHKDVDNTQDNLVCIKSNTWIDIPKKDNYVQFSFRGTCEIEPKRIDLIVKYIETFTETSGVYLTSSKDMDLSERCVYQCYIGEEGLYMSEDNMEDLKSDLSYFEKGDVLVSYDENVEPGLNQICKDGVIFSPHGKNIHPEKKKYSNQKDIDLIFGKNSENIHQDHVFSLENEELPKHSIPSRKLFGFVESFLKNEDPVHTPYKISQQLDNGGIDFISYNKLLQLLEDVPEVEVETHVTEDPDLFILTLRVNEISFLVIENDGIYEIIYVPLEANQKLIDPHHIDDIITKSCKNHVELKKLNPRQKLDIFIHDEHGVILDPDNLCYCNPHTSKLFPPSIIHNGGVSWKGFEVPYGSYDPHVNVHIQIPVKVIFENLGNSISIKLKTPHEECYLDEDFQYSPTMVQEDELKHLIRKLWKKGYLHDDYSLANIIRYNNVKPGHIKKPWWFQGNNKKQTKDLIRFISQF